MPRIFRDRVYFDLQEAAAQMGISSGIMGRWVWESEHHLNDEVELFHEGAKKYISQSCLKKLVGSERWWSEYSNSDQEIRAQPTPRSNFASCFISYSTKDQSFAERLYNDLLCHQIRCWFAPHSIRGGKKLHDQISSAIQNHDRLLLILSEHSMASQWVRMEVHKTLNNEDREGRQMLFPIRLVPFETLRHWECFDATLGIDIASQIREYYVPDFSQWDDPIEYQKALAALLRDLETVEI